jgi:hypothetical protein
MCHIFFIYSSVDEHVGWVHVLATVNSVTINMDKQVSLFYADFHSSWEWYGWIIW